MLRRLRTGRMLSRRTSFGQARLRQSHLTQRRRLRKRGPNQLRQWQPTHRRRLGMRGRRLDHRWEKPGLHALHRKQVRGKTLQLLQGVAMVKAARRAITGDGVCIGFAHRENKFCSSKHKLMSYLDEGSSDRIPKPRRAQRN
jgi:hypothetical protein